MRLKLRRAVTVLGAFAVIIVAVILVMSGRFTASPALSMGVPGLEPAIAVQSVARITPRTADGVFFSALTGGTVGNRAGAMDAQYEVGGDTIRYRVCKDLSICYLEFASPPVDLANPLIPLDVGTPHLVPVELLAAPVIGDARWALLGLPLLAGYALLRDDDYTPPGDDDGPPAEPPPPTHVIPEPASMLLLGTGLAGMALHRRLRRKEAVEVGE